MQKFIDIKLGLMFFILWYCFPDTCWIPSVYVKHKIIPSSNERRKSAGVSNKQPLLLHHNLRSVIGEATFFLRDKAAE